VVVVLEHPVFLVRVALLFMVLDLAAAQVAGFTAAAAARQVMQALVVLVVLVLTLVLQPNPELLVLEVALVVAVAV
jgi:hypothetical protein